MKILHYKRFVESVQPVESTLDPMALKRMKLAVVHIINRFGFFAKILFNLNIVESNHPSCKTMRTDGISIEYNPDFVNKLTNDEIVYVLCHECMHNVLLHFSRMGSRVPLLWNYAGDYAINLLLGDGIGKRPVKVLYDTKYKDLSSEQIYSILYKDVVEEIKKQLGKGKGKGDGKGEGEGEGDGGEGSGGGSMGREIDDMIKKMLGDDPTLMGDIKEPGDIKAQPGKTVYRGNTEDLEKNKKDPGTLEKMWRGIARDAASRSQGDHMPDSMKRFIGDINDPVVDWRMELKRFLVTTYNKMKYIPINRRYIHSGIYIPGISKESKEHKKAVIIVDTSGSISQVELDEFSSELNAIYGAFDIETSYVIWCDSDIRHIQGFGKKDNRIPTDSFSTGKFDIKKLDPKGGGGTSFVPPFMWINEYLIKKGILPSFVVYFTDSYGDPPKLPVVQKYVDKIMWLIIGGAKGEHITLGKKILLKERIKKKN